MVLSELARLNGTDKFEHGYCPYYEHHLPPRESEFSLLEIGVQSGGSLRMWRDFFPNAKIFGVDIDPHAMVEEDRIQTFCGDATSKDFLDGLEISNLQVIIDDASHRASDIVKTFELLWDRLPSGGLYVIEDLLVQWSVGMSHVYEGSNEGSVATRMLEGLMADTFCSEVEKSMEMHLYTEIAFLRK